MKIIFFVCFLFFSNISLSNELIEGEQIINKTILLDKFLVKENYLLPSNHIRLFWYSEKNRLDQVNRKLEILSEVRINYRNVKQTKSIADFFLKTPASGVTKNLNLDARWLEVNPKHNPILRKGDRIVFHDLARELYFLAGNHLCKVNINDTFNILDYLEICNAT